MDTQKIGLLIKQCRKKKNMTQKQLAEKLGVSDKSVSKWERGIHLPDASLYMPLCDILGLTLNEFFSGEQEALKKDEFVSTELLEKEYKRNLKQERINLALFIVSMMSVPFSIFLWHWNLGWLVLEDHLAFYSHLWYLSSLYFIAYFLIYRKKRLGYYLIWGIYIILSTGVIALWGYQFDILLSQVDLWMNCILTISGICQGHIVKKKRGYNYENG